MTLLGCLPAQAERGLPLEYYDSVEVSILTCAPHDEIYSLYGHTALRWHDLHRKDADLAFNYGVFNYNAPFFLIRFVFGWTDYELGVIPYRLFLSEYKYFGSSVTEQVLNLTPAEKEQLQEALALNLQPENKIYRYNYFYNNCTTKARDIVEQCVSGKLEYEDRPDYRPTYREMVHEQVKYHPWARFGNDLLLGLMADRKTTRRQQEFLPVNLLYDFDHASIYANGQYVPLVKERRQALPSGVQLIQGGFPLTPSECGILLFVVSLAILALEYRGRRIFWGWDVLLLTAVGLVGIVLFLMLFSQHPTVSLNLQLLLFNPLPLFFLPSVVRRKPKSSRWWNLQLALLLLFFIGGLWQCYAEGVYFVALSLLTRYWANTKIKVAK